MPVAPPTGALESGSDASLTSMSKILFSLGFLASSLALAADLTVDVRAAGLKPLDQVVIYAIPQDGLPLPPPGRAIMDQRDRTFTPHILPIQTGTAVSFPNNDNIRHQVYSFSPPRRFQIPLYEGTPSQPIVFDKPGVLALGCNIHDRMSAYLVVVDTPYFGLAQDGQVQFRALPAGTYEVHVWHPGLRRTMAPQLVTLNPSDRHELLVPAGPR